MSNGEAPQDPDHAKKMQEFLRAKELDEAEKAKLDAEKNRLEAQKALDAQKASAADEELKAKTAAATAAKALADSEVAAFKARFGEVPAHWAAFSLVGDWR